MSDQLRPKSRRDSTSSIETLRPPEQQRRTPSPERSQRMAEESARQENIAQRSRDLQDAKRDFPNALKSHNWEDYTRKLETLKTTDPSNIDYGKTETILDFYDRRIEAEKNYIKIKKEFDAKLKILEDKTLLDNLPSSSSSSSGNESGDEGNSLMNRK